MLEHRQPHRQAVGAVQEQQRGARAAAPHPHRHAADLVARQRRRHALPSLILDAQCSPPCRELPGKDTDDRHRYRTFPPAPLCRAAGATRRMRDPRQADRSRRRCAGAGGQPARGLVQGGRAGEGGADRQRDGVAQAARAGARHRRGRPDAGARQAARQPGQAGEGRGQGRAGAAGGAEGRGRRPLRAAGASAARRGRRAVHFRRARLRDLPRHRLDQCRLPPHHAARPAHRRRRHDRAERRARDLSRGGGEGREAAGVVRGRLARRAISWRRCQGTPPMDELDVLGALAAGAGAGGEVRHQRHLRAGRRRIRAGGLSRSARATSSRKARSASTSATTAS